MYVMASVIIINQISIHSSDFCLENEQELFTDLTCKFICSTLHQQS